MPLITARPFSELAIITNNGKLTVAGTTTSPATNVTVNTTNAVLYADATFAATNFTMANGDNTFTAIAKDSLGRKDTNSITVNLPATNSFAYDLNGNMLTNGSEIMVWNDENELVTNFVANSWKSEFVYDGKMRRRIERDYSWNGSAWTQTNEIHFIYDGNVILQQRDGNNLPVLTLTRGNDLSGSLQGAGGIGGLLAMTESYAINPIHSFYHADGNGNVTMLINASQAIVGQAEYDSFGGFLSLSGPKAGVNSYWYSSKPIHWPSGKYDFLYRWYAPNLQRWPNSDPIGEPGFEVLLSGQADLLGDGPNLYSFVRNYPIGKIDPFGLKDWGKVVDWAYTTSSHVLPPPAGEMAELLKGFGGCGGVAVALKWANHQLEDCYINEVHDNNLCQGPDPCDAKWGKKIALLTSLQQECQKMH